MDLKGRILIVDDDIEIVEQLQLQLQTRSYTLLTATSGEEALDIMNSNAIDILVTDVNMPGMDGVELLRQTRKNHPNIDCIVMTSYAGPDLAKNCFSLGAVSVLQKMDALDLKKLTQIFEKCMKEQSSK